MAMESYLVPPGTQVTANGEGAALDVSQSSTRTFLCFMTITDQLEQESLDVAIFGSEDGTNWQAKPILKFPQRFYRGETRMILDLAARPEVKFIRAQWELNRWGRVAPLRMFVFELFLQEVPEMNTAQAAQSAASA